MANPDITLLNATYNGVTGVTLPKFGGGTATFPWVEGSQTITQNGTVDVSSLAQVVVNVSGGGGASNVVTGTFKGTTTGAAMDVTLNYSGSGYPIALVIYPSGGAYNSSAASGTNANAWYNLIQRYAIDTFFAVKADTSQVPFQGTYNKATVAVIYKNSTSSADNYTRISNMAADTYGNSNTSATSTHTNTARFKSKTEMSVFIASTSYGFAANIEYTYWVIYSS